MDATREPTGRGRLEWAVVGSSGLTAALFAALMTTGAAEPVRMPTTPHAVTVLAAIAAATLVVVRSRLGYRARALIGAGCVVALAAGCVAAAPHTIMTLLVWVGGQLTGGRGPFDVTPAWTAGGAYLAGTAAAALLTGWVVVRHRHATGRCARCGRNRPEPGPPWRRLPVPAAVAVAGAVPYGALKLCWALGVPVWLTGHQFDAVTFTSPGFGDTVVLTVLGVVVAVCMGRGLTARWLRPALVSIGSPGSLMLLPVGAVGLVYTAQVVLGSRVIDGQEIAPWAFLLVYGSFLVWGPALATLTLGYLRSTRGVCGRHEVARRVDHHPSG